MRLTIGSEGPSDPFQNLLDAQCTVNGGQSSSFTGGLASPNSCIGRDAASVMVRINPAYDFSDYIINSEHLGINHPDTEAEGYHEGGIDGWIVKAWPTRQSNGLRTANTRLIEFTLTHISTGEQKTFSFLAEGQGDALLPSPI